MKTNGFQNTSARVGSTRRRRIRFKDAKTNIISALLSRRMTDKMIGRDIDIGMRGDCDECY